MKIIKKIKHRVAALVMSFFLALGLTTPAFNFTVNAEALEVANGACTIADIVFSYCASGGVAIINDTVIDEVYNVLGSSFGTLQTFVDNGLLTYSNGQYVDSGLATNIESAISNISNIDIGGLFNQTVEQNPAGVALSGAATLGGIAGSVATTGVLPVVAGVAVSGYCGFQIGTIISNMLEEFAPWIYHGTYLDEGNTDIFSLIPNGARTGVYFKDNEYRYFSGVNCIPVCYVRTDNRLMVCLLCYSGSDNNTSVIWTNDQGVITNSGNQNLSEFQDAYGVIMRNYASVVFKGFKEFPNQASYENFVNGLRNGTVTIPPVNSPDCIGTNGNLIGEYNNNEYNIPDMQSVVDPETQSIDPSKINQDYLKSFLSTVNDNNNNLNPDNNESVFNDIIDKIRINEPTPAPEPEPEPDPDPNPNPDPETVPVPDVNPYPDTYPVADPETVPDNKPQPEYTEKATENETDITEGDPYTTPDLLDKFPFCIPRDILRAFKKLDSGCREAPHIQWRFHPNEMIDYTFDVDFSTWDNVAVLLRLLELIAFIVLLGIATRNLILS